jgi:hypothetical protein
MPVKIWENGSGIEFHVPTSGGKAGKGKNVTSTLQVRKGGRIVKQFVFVVADRETLQAAVRKATEFIQTPVPD